MTRKHFSLVMLLIINLDFDENKITPITIRLTYKN